MGKKYVNSPIIEAVCEFKFSEDTKWDLAIPGLIYEVVKERYPDREQRVIQEVNIAPPKESSGKLHSQIRTSEFAVFLAENKKTFIQVGPRTLSINQLKPYLTWNDFKSQIEYGFNSLCKKAEINAIQRIGLRYINKIEIPGKSINIEDYFEFRPHFGPDLPQSRDNFLVGCIFSFSEKRDTCKVQLTPIEPEDDSASAFMLDLDYTISKPQGLQVSRSLEWVEEAHRGIEATFEGCISGALRDLFKEEK